MKLSVLSATPALNLDYILLRSSAQRGGVMIESSTTRSAAGSHRGPSCPECGGQMAHASGCEHCLACGHSRCSD